MMPATAIAIADGDRLLSILIGRESGTRCEHVWEFIEPTGEDDDYAVKCQICGADRHA
jgi:hypothetical protein